LDKYDIIIVGSGSAGIFAALELIKKSKEKLSILLLEKGRAIKNRTCPKRTLNKCMNCNPCNITSGFSGAGAFSDGKLSLSPDVGGTLIDYIGYEETQKLIQYVDGIYLQFGADKKVYGLDNPEIIEHIRTKAIQANLKLVECPIRHLGTDGSYEIYTKLQNFLIENGVEIQFDTEVIHFLIENKQIKGVVTNSESYFADKVIVAVGREGSDWFQQECNYHKINTEVGVVDIGVRVETRNEIMKELNEAMYESKLIYYTPTFDDKVRTFCNNPSGVVATEHYNDEHGTLATVNGHSYKSDTHKTDNTNFALLVSKKFTEPFNEPIKYGKYIAQLGNMLAGGKIIVQRYGDFKQGRRTTSKRLIRNNITPTLNDAVAGDLSLVLPYRIMLAIDETIQALNKVAPGLASDETLLYGVEVKFYSNKIKVDKNFETNIRGLYVAGDGAGITRGLMQAACNGVYIARVILNEREN
jgi:uncharacterized FAD-dependent dehydrogenase